MKKNVIMTLIAYTATMLWMSIITGSFEWIYTDKPGFYELRMGYVLISGLAACTLMIVLGKKKSNL